MDGEYRRIFLFLQGPHGPFFRRLAKSLVAKGAEVHRVCFNPSDEAEWRQAGPVFRTKNDPTLFRDWLEQHIAAYGITDIVLYGDTRPVHRVALEVANSRGLNRHCFEEGYLRPSWVTYERGGTNANSEIMDISLPRMAAALGSAPVPDHEPSAIWGDYRQHLWFSAWYHIRCLIPNRRYGQFDTHREITPFREFMLYVKRTAQVPAIWFWRTLREWALLRSDKTFHLVLLQLSFDASMQEHSDFENTSAFVEKVIDAFAEGAPQHHYLVLKAHPFEDGRERLATVIRTLAEDLGVSDRIVFIDGGKKLAALLDRARTAITVNSTAAQQALWRGLPVAALGRAIYRKPGLVSEQDLISFLRHPRRPDLRSYWLFRQFLLQTSQIQGSFYARNGISALVRALPALMLDDEGPYQRVFRAGVPAEEVRTITGPSLVADGS